MAMYQNQLDPYPQQPIPPGSYPVSSIPQVIGPYQEVPIVQPNFQSPIGSYQGFPYESQPMNIPNLYPESGLKALENIDKIWISQKPQYMENCTCEFENRYSVYKTETKGKKVKKDKYEKLFKAKEYSTCCQRCCMAGSTREFNMDVNFRKIYFDSYKNTYCHEWTPFLRLERKYTCTCCCYNRPYISITEIEGNNERILGYIFDDFACCDLVFKLKNLPYHEPFYTIKTSRCQCGFLCPCTCKCCNTFTFDIIDENFKESTGSIKKVWGG